MQQPPCACFADRETSHRLVLRRKVVSPSRSVWRWTGARQGTGADQRAHLAYGDGHRVEGTKDSLTVHLPRLSAHGRGSSCVYRLMVVTSRHAGGASDRWRLRDTEARKHQYVYWVTKNHLYKCTESCRMLLSFHCTHIEMCRAEVKYFRLRGGDGDGDGDGN